MKRFCGNCGQEIKENVLFCPSCGKKIEDTTISIRSKKTNPKKKKKAKGKKVVFLIAILFFIFLMILLWNQFHSTKNEEKEPIHTPSSYILESFSDVEIVSEESARKALEDVRSEIGIMDTDKDLELVYETKIDTSTFYRFKQYYKDLLVYGKEVLLESNDGVGENLVYNTISFGNFSTEFKHDEEEIKDVLKNYLKKDFTVLEITPIIYPEEEPVLAYLIRISFSGIEREFIVTDQEKIIENSPLIMGYKGLEGLDSTFTLDSRGLYIPSSKIGIYTGQLIPFTDSNNVTKEVFGYLGNGIKNLVPGNNPNKYQTSALEYINLAYRYFDEVLDHKSFDGKGKIEINVFLDVREVVDGGKVVVYLDNAAYEGYRDRDDIIITACNKCYNYSLAMLGHEYTHGVLRHIVGETNTLESQSFNEGYADIFAILMDQYFSGKLNFKLPVRNIAKLDSNHLKKYTPNLSSDPHENGTILSTAFYKMTQKGIKNNELLAKIFYEALYYMPQNATMQEGVNAILMAANRALNWKKISVETLNKIKEAFQEVGFDVEIHNQVTIDSSKVEFVKESFCVAPVNLRGTPMSKYNIKVELYDQKDNYIKTIVEKDYVNKGDASCYGLRLDAISKYRESYDQYYKITITIGDAISVKKIVPLEDDSSLKNVIYMFMDIDEKDSNIDREYFQIGSFKLPYGVYEGSNPYDDTYDEKSYYTLNPDGTFLYEREFEVAHNTIAVTIKGHYEARFGIAEPFQTKEAWIIYFFTDEGEEIVKETGKPYGYTDSTTGEFKPYPVAEYDLYDVVEDNGFQARQYPMFYTYIGKTKNE